MLFEGNCKPFANDLKAIYEKKVYYFESNKPLFELWYHQESNRGHKDFQSFALPTELWHQACKIRLALKRVVPPGIEPGTQGFSVLCSTN